MIPPTSIDGTDITGATIDGTDVQEITVDGQTVFTAGPPAAPVDRMYVAVGGGDVIQYDLDSKFSLSGTITQTASFNIGNATDVSLGNSGNRLYVASYSGDEIQQYDLTSAYDISNRSFAGSYSLGGAHGVTVSLDGTEAVLNSYRNFYDYGSLTTPYDISSFSRISTSHPFSGDEGEPDYVNDGQFLIAGDDDTGVEFTELSTPYDMTTAGTVDSATFFSLERAVHMSDDGSKLFVCDFFNDTINEFNLSTNYDITSAGSVVNSFNVGSNINGVIFV